MPSINTSPSNSVLPVTKRSSAEPSACDVMPTPKRLYGATVVPFTCNTLLAINSLASKAPDTEAVERFVCPVTERLVPIPRFPRTLPLPFIVIPVVEICSALSPLDISTEPANEDDPAPLIIRSDAPVMSPDAVIVFALNPLDTSKEPAKELDPVERPEKVPVNVSLPFTVRLPPIEA